MVQPTKSEGKDKKPYVSPALTIYGSVKEMTGANSGTNTGDSNTMMSAASDPALKENVVRVGDHPAGFGLYLFDYKSEFKELGEGRQFGVMADEVERIRPDAVSLASNGFRTVNYGMLGISRN